MMDDDKDTLDPDMNDAEVRRSRARTQSGYSADLEKQISSFSDKEMSLDAAMSESVSKKTPEERAREKKIILGVVAGISAILLLMALYSCQPNKGSMAYGICSTLLEMNTQYPHTINHVALEGSRTTVRIYYTSTDAFGQYKMEIYECKFGPDEKMGMRLTDIIWNRKSVDRAEVDRANKILPTIISSDPYRVAPPEWKNPLLKD